ncbi:MAG TPA: hypothetical protein VN943_06815 [Candidatus Acidoferrum sp.]|nr:hypothetical protein [Candidatus Acidoferrum sp.]
MKNNSLSRFLRTAPLVLALVSMAYPTAVAQESKVALPRVAGAAVPLYPPLARAAHVQGIVHVKVTTDGQRAVATHAEDGPKLLAAAAEENARTWQFAVHEPTTFTVTYHYKLVAGMKGNPDNPEVVLRLPTEVEVRTLPMPPIADPSPDKR